MGDTGFTGAVFVGQGCCGVQLVAGGVTGRITQAFERQRDGAQQRVAVRCHVLLQPAGVVLVVYRCGDRVGQRGQGAHTAGRRHKAGADAVEFGLGDGVRATVLRQDLLVFGFDLVDIALAFGLHQNLDTRLVDVVTAAPAVVHTHHSFEVVQDLVPRQKLADHRADDGCAAHATPHHHTQADVTGLVLQHMQTHVVPGGGGAVVRGAHDGDLELAWQERELGVQRAPLADDFCQRPWVGHLVGRNTGALVAGGVADAVAAGLDAVQVHAGQQIHHIGAFVQRNPVVLHVLARGEVRAGAGQAGQVAQARVGLGQVVGVFLVVVAGDGGQHPQLGAVQLAIRHGHPQHRCEALDVPAVLQPQWAEFIFRQRAALPALQLVAVLGGAQFDELCVEFCVLVHRRNLGIPPGFAAALANPLAGGDTSGLAKPVPRYLWCKSERFSGEFVFARVRESIQMVISLAPA